MDKNKNYSFTCVGSPSGLVEVVLTKIDTGERKHLTQSDFTVEGGLITLNKDPQDYFDP